MYSLTRVIRRALGYCAALILALFSITVIMNQFLDLMPGSNVPLANSLCILATFWVAVSMVLMVSFEEPIAWLATFVVGLAGLSLVLLPSFVVSSACITALLLISCTSFLFPPMYRASVIVACVTSVAMIRDWRQLALLGIVVCLGELANRQLERRLGMA